MRFNATSRVLQIRLLVEKFHSSKDNVIRRKIASLLADFVTVHSIDKHQLINQIVGFIRSEGKLRYTMG